MGSPTKGGSTMSAAQKATGPDRANDQPRQETTHTENLQTAEANRKRLATLKAKFAIRGFAVIEATQGYNVARWNLTRHCFDLDSLEAFARQVGAA